MWVTTIIGSKQVAGSLNRIEKNVPLVGKLVSGGLLLLFLLGHNLRYYSSLDIYFSVYADFHFQATHF